MPPPLNTRPRGYHESQNPVQSPAPQLETDHLNSDFVLPLSSQYTIPSTLRLPWYIPITPPIPRVALLCHNDPTFFVVAEVLRMRPHRVLRAAYPAHIHLFRMAFPLAGIGTVSSGMPAVPAASALVLYFGHGAYIIIITRSGNLALLNYAITFQAQNVRLDNYLRLKPMLAMMGD
ncbi:hypothetical protein BD779DRAFT_1477805 [Infundibulicybe gibba]|nr:hypothetical protein BD779DRAFT_1477805 [Infundibulicybe gibba]